MTVLMSTAGLRLTTYGISYDLTSGFLGSRSQQGYTPIQHVNAIELVTRRRFAFFPSLVVALVVGVVSWFFLPRFGVYMFDVYMFLPILIGSLVLAIWFFSRITLIVIYSEGTAFVEAEIAHEDSAVELINKYRDLKLSTATAVLNAA